MTINNEIIKSYNEILYILEGGGALGIYQVGVCSGLLEQGLEPTWVIGTSIGGINAAIMVGNKPEDRIPKLNQFWDSIALSLPKISSGYDASEQRIWENIFSSEWSLMLGISGFFYPRYPSPLTMTNLTPDKLSFYDTSALRRTLEKFVDFKILNSRKVRLTLNATRVEDGQSVVFDNSTQEIGPEHIMASAALPPGFPAIKIDDNYYWDGGLQSNTPLDIVVKEKITGKLLCLSMNLFCQKGAMPKNIFEVIKRTKDIEYANSDTTVINYFCELLKLRKMLAPICLDENLNKQHSDLANVCSLYFPPSLNMARFHYKDSPYDLAGKDFEFSAQSLQERLTKGYEDANKALKDPTWLDMKDDIIINNF